MILMAQRRKKVSGTHKPRRMVAIPEQFGLMLDAIVEREGGDVTEKVRTAVVEYLDKRGLIAPPPSTPFQVPARAPD